jgi:hypothetical protein
MKVRMRRALSLSPDGLSGSGVINHTSSAQFVRLAIG